MTSDRLATILVSRMAENTDQLHRRTRENALLRDALTALRVGRSPGVILAELEAEGIALTEPVTR